MAKICLCLNAKTIKRNLEILNKYRMFADLAELRVDCLEPDEKLLIRRFPELAGLPVILTIRRDIDGGRFTEGEGARVTLLARGLAFAKADRRKNFAYVDIEDDLEVPSLEEAARTFGTRIIRSYHNLDGIINDIPAKIKSMQHIGDEIVKIAVKVNSTSDVLNVYNAGKSCDDQEKILICMGHYGVYSRILAEKFGSFLTYSSALSENEGPAAAGQIDVQELSELYRFQKINKKTNIFGIIGDPLKTSVSPWFFNSVFKQEEADAVYVPFPATSLSDILKLIEEMNVLGLTVTIPYKEEILAYLAKYSDAVKTIGACNTISRSKEGWLGENTNYSGFSDSLLNFLDRKNLKWQKVTIIGAGGVARAAAAAVYNMKGKALILNRSVHKARSIASQYNFRWGGLDAQGIEIMNKYSDIIIQASSAGMAGMIEGSETSDPIEIYNFTGKEAVMDLVYKPEVTPLLKRAAAAGCRTINGYDMVIRQDCIQYTNFTGMEIPHQSLTRVKSTGADTWYKIKNY